MLHHAESINLCNYLGWMPLQQELRAEGIMWCIPFWHKIAVEGHAQCEIWSDVFD